MTIPNYQLQKTIIESEQLRNEQQMKLMKTPTTKTHWSNLVALGAVMQLTLAVSSHATIFTVSTTADSGPGSLRQAILDANASVGVMDTIAFNISGTGPHTNQPLSSLPDITDPVVIDGYTQPGSSPNTLVEGDNAVLKVVLDGTLAGDELDGAPPILGVGLMITCGNTTVRGLVIANFSQAGIVLQYGGGNVIEGNFLGTDSTGTIAQGNSLRVPWEEGAVRLAFSSDNLIGGTTPAARNLISGNQLGINISPGERNRIQGNFIGTDATGTKAVPNVGRAGVFMCGACYDGSEDGDNVIGGSMPGAGNLISGNHNVQAEDPAHRGEGGYGIMVNNRGATVIQGNRIGTDVTGKAKLGNQHGVAITAWTAGNKVGGVGLGEGNLISGNDFVGLSVTGEGVVVQGNRVGTDITGTLALGNLTGIDLQGQNSLIGGADPNARNLISGNSEYGLQIQGPFNLVQGNFIGTDVTGTEALPNWEGIAIFGYNDNVVGGTVPGARNLISGNGNIGVDIRSTRTKLQGNFIGTDVTGTQALGNSGGVYLAGVSVDNTIGGATPETSNLISGNLGQYGGIWLNGGGVTGTRIQGNLIGTDLTGTQRLGNSGGVIISSSTNNTIGGTETGAGNVIASSEGPGIALIFDCAGTRVEGNFIGTDRSATLELGNGAGIWVWSGGTDNKLGGSEPGAANVIVFNRDCGVTVCDWVGQPPSGTAVRGNSIYSNGGLGIDLSLSGYWSLDGPTPNDPGDADTGPNNLQNFPTITSATASPGSVQIQGTLSSKPNQAFILDFYANPAADPSGYGEGETYLGAASVTTDASGDASFNVTLPVTVAAGQIITATATDPDGNTSEFSQTMRTFPADACGYDLLVEVGYEFGGTGTSGLYTASPDSGFVIIKNNGPAPFVGELRLDGVSGVGQYGHQEIHDTSGPGYILAPGASFRLEAGNESSNYGGWNKFNQACNGPDNGLLLSIIGKSAGLDISYQVFDKDIHSGVFRDIHASPSLEIGAPLLSDSYILQGGDPFGGDTGDNFEVTQAHAIFHVQAACADACTLICPGNISVCDDQRQCGAIVNFESPSLSGGCQGVTISCAPPSGSFFPAGTTTVLCTATDGSGNATHCAFTVTVTETDPPPIACPKDITVGNDPGQCGAIVNYRHIQQPDDFNDGNDDGWSLFAPLASPSVTFPAGGYRLSAGPGVGVAIKYRTDANFQDFVTSVDFTDWTVVNQSFGIFSRGNFGVQTTGYALYLTLAGGTLGIARVDDFSYGPYTGAYPWAGVDFGGTLIGVSLDPVKTYRMVFTGTGPSLKGQLFELTGSGPSLLVELGVNDASYAGGVNGLFIYDRGAGSMAVTFDNFFASGALSGRVTCSPPSGSFFPVGTTTVTCTEANGCVQQCTFTVTVVDMDHTPPVIPALANVTGQCSATVTTPTTTDHCGGTVTGTTSDPLVYNTQGTFTVHWTFSDGQGNSSTANQTVIVQDTIAPVITGCPANITVQTGPGRTTCDQVATWTEPTASDNCTLASFTSTHASGDTFPVGTTTVTYTATDGANPPHTVTCSFTVAVEDNTPPTITCPADLVIVSDRAACGVGDQDDDDSEQHEREGLHRDEGEDHSHCKDNHDEGDQGGHGYICKFWNRCRATGVVLTQPLVADNCGIASLVNDHSSTTYPLGMTLVTWTVTDTSGNTATCVQKVTVVASVEVEFAAPVVRKPTCNTIRRGQVVPVKVELENCLDQAIRSGVTVKLQVQGIDSATGTVFQDVIEDANGMGTDGTLTSDGLMQLRDGKWQFNLDTSNFGDANTIAGNRYYRASVIVTDNATLAVVGVGTVNMETGRK